MSMYFLKAPSELKISRSHALGALLGLAISLALWATVFTWLWVPGPVMRFHGLHAWVSEEWDSEKPMHKTNPERDFSWHSASRKEMEQSHFRMLLQGGIRISQEGSWIFRIQSKQGARLWVDDQMVVDNWQTTYQWPRQGEVRLTPGYHEIKVSYFNILAPAFLKIDVKPPGKRSFRPLSWRDCYLEEPTASAQALERRWEGWRGPAFVLSLLLTGAGLIVCALHRQQSWAKSGIRVAIALSALALLWNAHGLRPEHQYGLTWFVRSPWPLKLLLSACLLMAFSGHAGGMFRRLVSGAQNEPPWRKRLFLTTLIGTVLGTLFCQMHPAHPFLGACAMALACWTASLQKDSVIVSSKWPFWRIGLGLMAVAAIAAFFRFYRLAEMPPGLWEDEAREGLAARDAAAGKPLPLCDWMGCWVTYQVVAIWFRIFGDSVYAFRAHCATVGILTALCSYGLFRLYVGPGIALWGAGLVAASRWLFTINRVAMFNIDHGILMTVGVLYVYLQARRSGRWIFYALSGLLLGLCFHIYLVVRALPVVVGTDLVWRVLTERRAFLKSQGRQSAAMLGIALVVASPMLLFALQHPQEYFFRTSLTLLSTECPGVYLVRALGENVVHYIEMYAYRADYCVRHNVPFAPALPPGVVPFAAIGLARLIARPGHRERFLWLSLLGLVSLQGVLTGHDNTGNMNRVSSNIPLVFLCACWGLVWIMGEIREFLSPEPAKKITASLALGTLLFCAAWDYRLYFQVHLKNEALIGETGFYPEVTEMARYASGLLRSDPPAALYAENREHVSFLYLAGQDVPIQTLTSETIQTLSPVDGKTVFLVTAANQALYQGIRQKFPDAAVKEIPYSLLPEKTLFYEVIVSGPAR